MRIPIVEVLACLVIAAAGAALCFHGRSAPPGGGRAQRTNLVHPASPECEIMHRRGLVKCRLARRIAAERTPLPVAVEWFDRANGDDGMEALARFVPGRSVREKLCRQVIEYVVLAEAEWQQEGGSLPEPRASAELQAELDRRLAAGEFPPEPGGR